MLSPKEKQEMLKDARSLKRKASFRTAQIMDPQPSLDAYLKFLTGVHKVFMQISVPSLKISLKKFKL